MLEKNKSTNRKILISQTVKYLSILPMQKLEEIAEFVKQKHEENQIKKELEFYVSSGTSFKFLKDEESIYSLDDIIGDSHEKR
ncbi:MAG: hypothetical protein U9P79_05385 [Candidatus Cloacimonadota bacterium]|nr:hypothetical protein [Candidatus Cloacimonadota bacterium]